MWLSGPRSSGACGTACLPTCSTRLMPTTDQSMRHVDVWLPVRPAPPPACCRKPAPARRPRPRAGTSPSAPALTRSSTRDGPQDRHEQHEWPSGRGAAARRVIPLLHRGEPHAGCSPGVSAWVHAAGGGFCAALRLAVVGRRGLAVRDEPVARPGCPGTGHRGRNREGSGVRWRLWPGCRGNGSRTGRGCAGDC